LVDFARPFVFSGATMSNVIARLAVPVAFAALVSGCAFAASPTVAELKSNPGRFQDRTVSLNGVVTSSWGLPMVPFRLYRIDDGTGEVTVVAQEGRVPSKGARVRVKGKVNDVATLGGQSLGLHIRQTDLDFKR
jgi:hypothetical protein